PIYFQLRWTYFPRRLPLYSASGFSHQAKRPCTLRRNRNSRELLEALQVLKYSYQSERLTFVDDLLASKSDYNNWSTHGDCHRRPNEGREIRRTKAIDPRNAKSHVRTNSLLPSTMNYCTTTVKGGGWWCRLRLLRIGLLGVGRVVKGCRVRRASLEG
ncbi:hypothetical protein B0H34DRAFT_851697, partial [Crassisporium funariophilum]